MQRRTERIARAVFGASLALTLVAAASPVQRPDAWVTTKVKMSLLTSEGFSARNVQVDTVAGRVTLHGSVPTEAEKTRAEQLAGKIEGASQVRNLLQVIAPEQAAEPDQTDAELEQSVKARLLADPALEDSWIRVESVNAGVVLLSGKAQTLSDASRALDVTARVPGVRRVATEIETPDTLGDNELWREGGFDARAYQESAAADLWITTAAKLRLMASSETPGADINVDTRNGVVTLFGIVDSSLAKQAVEAEVRKVGGVENVVNDLRIVPASKQQRAARSDEQISKAIQALFAATDDLDDSKIAVEVSDGVARLTGTVKTRTDQVTALSAARSMVGVVRVIDELQLETPPAVSTL
jgi:hyperosmotically inducible protein